MQLQPPTQSGINSRSEPTTPQLKLPAQGQLFSTGGQVSRREDIGSAFSAWKESPGMDTQAALLRSLEPSMRAATRKYAGSDDPLALGQAKLLVIKSLPKYDPKSSKIETYVDRQLQPLMRWSSRRKQALKLPDRALMDVQKLAAAERELEIELGRAPDTLALSDHTGIPVKRIAKLRAANMHTSVGSAELGEGSDGDTTFAEDMAVSSANSTAWARMVRDDLSTPDRFILEHTLGLDGAPVLSNKQIAERLKISPGAVSQRKTRIQNLLDQESELSPFYG